MISLIVGRGLGGCACLGYGTALLAPQIEPRPSMQFVTRRGMYGTGSNVKSPVAAAFVRTTKSGMGQKRTSQATPKNVCFWG